MKNSEQKIGAERDVDELVPEDDTIIAHALRWSLIVIGVVGGAGALLFLVRRSESSEEVVLEKKVGVIADLETGEALAPDVRFTDVTSELGIDFVHHDGARGEKLLPETMGGGAAFFDYDGDGDQDLFFVNGASLTPGDDMTGPGNRLYRNEGGRFVDVTEGSGLSGGDYAMGVAAGDYDADGRVDLFTTGVGQNRLYRNTGAGFEDVTLSAGVGGEADRWTTSAGFFDYDRDGDLDLFVCNYVRWSRDIDLKLTFTLNGTDRAYGPPMNYEADFSTLYRNEGDGTFQDVSEAAGIQVRNAATNAPMGKALGVAFVDFDRDGWLDVFVANDTVQNHLFQNQGDGTFVEIGGERGVGYDGNGKATGAMGIDIADYRNDGTLGVCIGNFANEMSSLYVSDGSMHFSDDAMREGIGSPSRRRLSFGLFFFDYDLDGRLDLLQVNGHLEESINEVQPSQRYLQPLQLFWNAGADRRSTFLEVPNEGAGDLERELAGRGSCYADFDGDGDLDVLVVQVGGRPLLLRNDQELDRHWLRVRLVDSGKNRDAIGAWVILRTGDSVLRRQVMPTRSYLSQSELPVTFGLGAVDTVDSLEIVWPDGETQSVVPAGIDTEIVIER
jgi:hypothetical protein